MVQVALLGIFEFFGRKSLYQKGSKLSFFWIWWVWVWSVSDRIAGLNFGHLMGVKNSLELRKAYDQVQPKIVLFTNKLNLGGNHNDLCESNSNFAQRM